MTSTKKIVKHPVESQNPPKILPKKSKRLNFSGSSAHFFALVLRYNFPCFRKFSKIRIDFYDQMSFFSPIFFSTFYIEFYSQMRVFLLYFVFFKIQNCVLTFIPKWDFSSFFDSDHYLFYNLNGQKRSLNVIITLCEAFHCIMLLC